MGLILADTNIVIYTLKGVKQIEPYFEEYEFSVSDITIIELLGVRDANNFTLRKRKDFIDECWIHPFNSYVREIAIRLKQKYTLKIPDAIIASTSVHYDIPILTADSDFKKIKEIEAIIINL
jgi:predicted nucleic acid-binding protein